MNQPLVSMVRAVIRGQRHLKVAIAVVVSATRAVVHLLVRRQRAPQSLFHKMPVEQFGLPVDLHRLIAIGHF